MTTADFPYVWVWRQRTVNIGGARVRAPWFGDGVDRAGRRCRVVVRGTRNTALVEFADGYQVITSRGGLRRVSPAAVVAGVTSRPVPGGTSR